MENKIYLASIDGGTYASESKISNAFGMHGKTIVSDSEITKVDGFIDLNRFKKSSETDFKDLKDGLKKSEQRRLAVGQKLLSTDISLAAANLRIKSLTKSYEECKRELDLMIERISFAKGVVHVKPAKPVEPIVEPVNFKSRLYDLSNAHSAVIIQMYNKNKTREKISDMIGRSIYVTNRIIREMINNGVLSPRKPLRQKFRRCFDNVEDMMLIQLYKNDISIVDIGKKIGRSKQSICNRIHILKRKGMIKELNAFGFGDI